MPALEGIKYGLLLSIMIGPVFFALIQTSIIKGFRASIPLIFGIAVSDALYILLTVSLTGQLADSVWLKPVLGYAGSALLLAIGIQMTYKALKNPVSLVKKKRKTRRITGHFFMGFLLNTSHPGVLMFWLALNSFISLKYAFDVGDKWSFYTAMMCTVMTTDFIKSISAKALSRYLKPLFLRWMNGVMGIVLVLFGLHLLWEIVFSTS